MKKISLLIILLLASAALPVTAGGEEGRAIDKTDFTFLVLPAAGPEQAEFVLVLGNSRNTPLLFEFPTAQKYEITVFGPDNQKVFQYSEGKAFAQAFETVDLKPLERISWKESWDYYSNGVRVKEGEYTVIAELKAASLNGKPINQSLKIDQKTMYVPGENPVFKGVKVEGSNGIYKVTGQGRPISGKFYYTVEDGHNELIGETEVPGSKYPEWKPFMIDISIPENKLPGNGALILNLYERSKDGAIIHTYPVLLERFNSN